MSATAEEVATTKTARGTRQASGEVSASDPAAPLETAAPPAEASGVQRPVHYGPGKGYVERDDFVSNPTDMVGEFNTVTEGSFLGSVTTPSPIFDRAREIDLRTALRAVDPNDTEVPEHLVVLPDSGRTIDGAKQALVDAAAAAGVDTSAHEVPLSDGTIATASTPTPPATPTPAPPETSAPPVIEPSPPVTS
jgi:hypothetical protein